MKKKFIIGLILISVASLCGIAYALFIHKEVEIKKFDKEIRVSVFTEYNDPGVDMCYGSIIKCSKMNYEIEGEVDTTKLGDYEIKYKYQTGANEHYLKRKVVVYDDVNPEIEVTGDLVLCPNKSLVEKAYKATDNYDGDLTDKVELLFEEEETGEVLNKKPEITEEDLKDKTDPTIPNINEAPLSADTKETIYLTVSDSSDNKCKVKIEPKLYDGEPTITLKGSTSDTLIKGSKYSEPGYSAIDKCDGDLTKDVKVSGSVDTSKIGTYTITYEVTNSIGKKVTKTRTIKVINKQVVTNIGATGSKIIYLTFDDGPSAYTTKLLNILDKYGIKATFFVTGNNVKLIAEEKRRGHTVCIHTYSHDYAKIYKSVDAYFADLNKMNNIIKQQTGSTVNCLRFPGGSSNTVSKKYSKGIMTTLTQEVTARGYRYYDWNIASGDAGETTKSSGVYNNVVKRLKGGVYNVLFHDSKSYTVNAIEDIIKYGLAHGYTFLPITSSSPTFHHGVNN